MLMEERVRAAYSARAQEYISVIGKIENASKDDREYLLTWARSVWGSILDVGCGPGQWTNYLSQKGFDIEGVDPVARFVEDARKCYPSVHYRQGSAEELEVPDGSLGGVLAWFSLIHSAPECIGQPLGECARALRAGGSLALGFFVGPQGEAFDHAVTTAYYWSLDALAEHLGQAGFLVIDAQSRDILGARTYGRVIARRRSGGQR